MSTMTQTPQKGSSGLDAWFEITKRGSDMGREIRGGIVTFITMAYIVVLNPLIMGFMPDKTGNFLGWATKNVGNCQAGVTPGFDGKPVGVCVDASHIGVPNLAAIAAATAILAGVLTLAMGIYGRMPIALAAGLGLNGFVTYGLAANGSWSHAMGLVVIEGLLILILVLTGFRRAVFEAVPPSMRYAIGVGIGLFITLIGFADSKIVQKGVVISTLGSGDRLTTWPQVVFCIGLLLTSVLVAKKVKGGILVGVISTTVVSALVEALFVKTQKDPVTGNWANSQWGLNVPKIDGSVFGTPDLSLFGHVDVMGALSNFGLATALAIFTLMLSDFFDTVGTVYGIAAEGDLLDEKGDVPHLQEVLVVDSVAAAAGGFAGTSSNTSYIESASGVGEGARTGLASVVTGALFLVAALFAPLVKFIPHEAATPALVVVGFLMMTQVAKIEFSDYTVGIPAFLTIVMIPFTYNIAVGIGAGFIAFVVLRLATGRSKEIKPLMYVAAGAFLIYFLQTPLGEWLL